MRARCGVVARSACKQAISRRLTPTPSRWSDKPGGLEVPSSNLGAPMKRKALLRRGFLVIGTRLPPCPQWSHRAQTSPREPSLLTRERFFAVFDPDDVAGRAGAEAYWDLQYAGRVGDHVDPDLVEGDRQGLVTIADPLKRLADLQIAHHSRKRLRDRPAFGDRQGNRRDRPSVQEVRAPTLWARDDS